MKFAALGIEQESTPTLVWMNAFVSRKRGSPQLVAAATMSRWSVVDWSRSRSRASDPSLKRCNQSPPRVKFEPLNRPLSFMAAEW
jgi:hypothetical protein